MNALDLGAKYTYAPWGLTGTFNVKKVIGDVHIETAAPTASTRWLPADHWGAAVAVAGARAGACGA